MYLLIVLAQLEAGHLQLSLRDILNNVTWGDPLAGTCLGTRGDGLLQ